MNQCTYVLVIYIIYAYQHYEERFECDAICTVNKNKMECLSVFVLSLEFGY